MSRVVAQMKIVYIVNSIISILFSLYFNKFFQQIIFQIHYLYNNTAFNVK